MKNISIPLVRALLALIVVLGLGFLFHADGAFHAWGTHRDVFRSMAVYGILACGMTVVIVSGGIDLSVGSVLAVASVSYCIFAIRMGWPTSLAVLGALGLATVAGLFSGGLISKFNMQPFIATLAMMVFARGFAKWMSDGQKVSTTVVDDSGNYTYVDPPALFKILDTKILDGNLFMVTVVFLVCVLITAIILSRMTWGRYLFAIGGNEEASRLCRVPVGTTKVLAYGYCALLAGIAGICQAAQETQGDPNAGITYELNAIAMVVIGGTSLAGGRGGVGLTLVGVLTISYLEKILSINAVGEPTRNMLTGLIIVIAVLFQRSRR